MLSEPRQRIVVEALTWEGTPWQHMQRCKGVGVDCIQITGAIGLTLGLLTAEQLKTVPYYSRQWHLHRNEEKLMKTLRDFGFTEVSPEEKQPGDVLVFTYGKAAGHSGIYLGDNMMIHAAAGHPHKVCQVPLDFDLTKRLRKAFVFPGI